MIWELCVLSFQRFSMAMGIYPTSWVEGRVWIGSYPPFINIVFN